MSRMRDQSAQAAAVFPKAPGSPRPPGAPTSPLTPGTPRANLASALRVPQLPPDSSLSDDDVEKLLAMSVVSGGMADNTLLISEFKRIYCVPPGPFYCEAERMAWLQSTPWCPDAQAPLVTVPTFTDEVTRSAWIATHPTCPVPPPVQTPAPGPAPGDHTCTPGDPSCGPSPAVVSRDTGGQIGSLLIGAVIGIVLAKLFLSGPDGT